jgi:cell wall-associated NlpC family hydrolase
LAEHDTADGEGRRLYNSVGVRNYPDYETGIQAMARTLTNGYYPRTLAGLQSNAPVVDDGEMGVWGTGGGAVRAQLAIVPENGAHEAAEVRAQLVAYALSLQGIPYVRGGRSATGGDCSGTMQHVYLTVAGVDIGGTTFSSGMGSGHAADVAAGGPIALAVVAWGRERRPYTEEQRAFFAKMEAQMREDLERER